MKVTAKTSYYDAEKGKVVTGQTWETDDKRGKELVQLGRVSEAGEADNDDNEDAAFAKGLKKADLQKIYLDELGEAADEKVTIPQLIDAIVANRNL